jgi:hypothetical protein
MNFISPGAKMPMGPPFGAASFQTIKKIKLAEQCFWDKWRKWYLPSISVARKMGDARACDFQPGDRVLLREGSNPLVNTWTIAEIVEVYPGSDGIVRSAMFDVDGARVVRDISRVSLLEGPVLRRRAALPAPPGGECPREPEADSGIGASVRVNCPPSSTDNSP